ncbi:MAG: response regulator [Wenzhouxiangella sp.]|nr:MAG: response regulator [Wenzhouxiangella sp.]
MTGSSLPDALRALNVLIVDDHEINREFLSIGLADKVARVETSADGASAVERCRTESFDVILMDLHMPQMDGLATAHRIRDLPGSSARSRMIVLTADARPEQRERLLAAGFDAYLNKPLSITDLIEALTELFEPQHGRKARHDGDSPRTTPLIDWTCALAAANGQEKTAARLAQMLGRELQERLPELDRMLAEGRKQEAAALLHQWAGAGGFAGAMQFSNACSILCRRLIQADPSSPGTAYAEFLRTAGATRQALTGRAEGLEPI